MGTPSLIVNGTLTTLDTVTFRKRGLGPRKHFPRSPFRLKADAEEFLQRLAGPYQRVIHELTEDDRMTGQFEPLYEGALRHPQLDELLALPQAQRMGVINTYFSMDHILAFWIREESPHPGCRWLIVNDLEDLRVEGTDLIIEGQVVPLTL